MIKKYLHYLARIDEKKEQMSALVEKWANIASGSNDLSGLNLMLQELKQHFSTFDGKMQEHTLKNGSALSIQKRESAHIQVLLCGHMDTVYSHHVTCIKEGNYLVGPGVADMKGGLVILLTALQAFESFSHAKHIGWTILITPDEEIGSIYSKPLLQEYAKKNSVGLVFEPALPDGSLVVERMGSTNYRIVFKGIAAHVGRSFYEGKSAISALASFIKEVEKEYKTDTKSILNFGHITGGSAPNVVAENATCSINFRSSSLDDMASFDTLLKKIKTLISHEHSVEIYIFQESLRAPKLFDEKSKKLFQRIQECAHDLGITIDGKSTGGVCDGNTLARAGLCNIDTMGPKGEFLHSAKERLDLESLTERAKLTCLFLLKLASKEISLWA
ncbi:MAG: hydrolase [Chlamydiales bacterium]|nr:hydrolase [Chlamydiales bacterium]